MLRRTSLGTLGLSIGGTLTLVGFWAYFVVDNATLNLVGFFYGIPLLLGGLALKASELHPVPLIEPTPANVLTLREQQATATQNQIRKDVTSLSLRSTGTPRQFPDSPWVKPHRRRMSRFSRGARG
jgi:hypothetical protein